jgi:nicotinate-nucleotide adenylyltransferase
MEQAQLDLLLIFPTGQAWHKTRPLSPAIDRIAMARLAFRELPSVQVDERETKRIGPTYTVDTLEALQRENPQAALSLFIGQDQAAAFTSWHRWQAVLEVATVFVAEREGTISGNGGLNTFDSLRDALQGAGRAANGLQPLMLPPMAISATDIRHRATKGLGISHLVPEAVAGYIAQHPLYRTA